MACESAAEAGLVGTVDNSPSLTSLPARETDLKSTSAAEEARRVAINGIGKERRRAERQRPSLSSLKRNLSRSDNDLLQLAFAHNEHSPPAPQDEHTRAEADEKLAADREASLPELSGATPEEESTDEEPDKVRSTSEFSVLGAPSGLIVRHNSEKSTRSKQSWRKRLESAYHDLKQRVGNVSFNMSLMNAYHKWTDSPVFMLGSSYDLSPKPGGVQRPNGSKPGARERTRQRIVSMIEQHFKNIIWVTYRKEFPAIEDSRYTSDSGWGCMLRSGQMMLAQALIINYMKKDWWRMSGNKSVLTHILRWFLDCAGPKCPYSVHNMLRHGKIYGKPIGEWFGPGSTCYMLDKCHEEHIISDEIRMVVGDDGVLYKDKILEEVCRPARHDTERKDRPVSTSSKVNASSERKLPDKLQRDADALAPGAATQAYAAAAGLSVSETSQSNAIPTAMWRPLIIFIPVRLGVSSINPSYIPSVKRCMELPQSLGFMGGRLRSSLYFVGFQGSKTLFLDPHTTQPALSVAEYERQTNAAKAIHSYFCSDVRSIEMQSIDPSLAFGFYCRNRQEFDNFWKAAQDISAMPYPAFTVADKTPSYEALDDLDDLDDAMDFPNGAASGTAAATASSQSSTAAVSSKGKSSAAADAGADADAGSDDIDFDGGDDFVFL